MTVLVVYTMAGSTQGGWEAPTQGYTGRHTHLGIQGGIPTRVYGSTTRVYGSTTRVYGGTPGYTEVHQGIR